MTADGHYSVVTAVPKLGDCAKFIRGITFKPEDVISIEDKSAVLCLRTRNVQTELDLSDVWGIPPNFIKRMDQNLLLNDILVSSANSWNLVGKCCSISDLTRPATFGGFVSVLRAEREILDPRYLYRWFSSSLIQTKVRSFGRQTTNISNLDINRCLDLAIPLPPLKEQRRIAAILDQADALRAKRRAALAQLDEMAQAIFVEMFGDPATNRRGWPLVRLGDLAMKFSDGPFGSNLKSVHYVENGIRVVRLQNIGVGEFLDDDRAFISE